MRIQHNVTALNAHRNLTNNNSALNKNLEKLSSGYRINRAGDDAAGLAISEKMRAQVAGLESAQKNAEDGVSLVQTAEGALTEVHSMLNRMMTLAVQSSNGTYNENNRAEMEKEVNALVDEINRIFDTTNFNDTYLFRAQADNAAGIKAADDVVLQVGETGATQNQITITLAGGQTSSAIKSAATKKAGGAGASLDNVATAIATGSTDASNAIKTINTAIDEVSSIRSDFGAIQNRLEHTINNLGVQNENITAAEARIRDVDMAKEMMAYTKNNILIQASQSMLAQANMIPQGVLQLLQ